MAVDLKIRVQLEKTIGQSLRLKPWESIDQVKFEDDSVTALFSVAEVQETTREVRVKRSGKRMMQWSRRDRVVTLSGVQVKVGEVWVVAVDETFWMESAPEEVHVKYGHRKTPTELAEQREFEKLCYRPGSSQTPLDNYERVVSGYTTDKMDRYW